MEWSRLKKELESRFSAPLRGRAKFLIARYRSQQSKPARAWLQVDGEEIHEFVATATTIPASGGIRERLEFGTFYQALEDSLSMSVETMLESDLLLLHALAVLDSRLGKRRLKELDPAHPLLARLIELRGVERP